jgi:hypothetical protein
MILVHRFLGEDGKVQYQLRLTLPSGETVVSPLLEKGELGKWAVFFLTHFNHPSPSPSPRKTGKAGV